MTQSYIDSQTLQPARFGELYTERNLRLYGEARWNTGPSTVQTQGLKLFLTPVGGGAQAISEIPDGSYNLSAVGNSLWVRLKRDAGTGTVLVGDIIEYTSITQPPPKGNWVQLFYRDTNEIIALQSYIIAPGPKFTKIGIARGNGIYDFIVGPSGDPYATHNSIQAAINDAVDGNRILILEGTYSIAAAQNGAVDASAAFAWTGKTLTLEGEGFGTVVVNTGGLTRAFGIRSGGAGVTDSLGNGSRVLNIKLQNFAQSARFDANGFGIRNCVVEVWQVGAASYTAPAVTGAGTSENNSVTETVQSTGITPNHQKFITNVSSGVGVINVNSKLRNGSAINTGRHKLPVYNTASRTAAASLEDGEIFWDTDTNTIEVRDSAAFVSFAPVPVGAYLFMGGTWSLAGNTGAYVDAPAPPANYVLCNGGNGSHATNPIADARSPFNGRRVPLLTDTRFLAGLASGGTLGTGIADLSHSHMVPSHNHTINHTHTVPSHRHSIPHSHVVKSHMHSVGNHSHNISNHQHAWMLTYLYAGTNSYNSWLLGPSTTRVASNTDFGPGNQGLGSFSERGSIASGAYYTYDAVNNAGAGAYTSAGGATTTSFTSTTTEGTTANSDYAGPENLVLTANSGPAAATNTGAAAPSLASINVVPKFHSCRIYLRIF